MEKALKSRGITFAIASSKPGSAKPKHDASPARARGLDARQVRRERLRRGRLPRRQPLRVHQEQGQRRARPQDRRRHAWTRASRSPPWTCGIMVLDDAGFTKECTFEQQGGCWIGRFPTLAGRLVTTKDAKYVGAARRGGVPRPVTASTSLLRLRRFLTGRRYAAAFSCCEGPSRREPMPNTVRCLGPCWLAVALAGFGSQGEAGGPSVPAKLTPETFEAIKAREPHAGGSRLAAGALARRLLRGTAWKPRPRTSRSSSGFTGAAGRATADRTASRADSWSATIPACWSF